MRTPGTVTHATRCRGPRTSELSERSTMTPPGRGPELSRRSLLRLGAVVGAGFVFGPQLAACAGPTGAPAPGSMTMALNRSLVSLDNKLNQFDAAVTVQRAVRQALTQISADLTPRSEERRVGKECRSRWSP